MRCQSLCFVSPYQVEIQEERLPGPVYGEVLVQTLVSAISAGTESLIYRGLFPRELPQDESISALSGNFEYPLKYGYCSVGQVIAVGEGVDRAWEGKQVFAFHPHESHFLAAPHELMPLPQDLSAEESVFLPNMETAVNAVMDGRPMIGEQVAVFGQGIVGLLTTALLALFPLYKLVTTDCYPIRRKASLELGAHDSLDPLAPGASNRLTELLPGGADLVYELSGAPEALNQAIAVTGFDGRVVVGSWYGQKKAELNLGGYFHRSRIRLVSSQVSSLAPELSGRWSKARRFATTWDMLRLIRPARFITHRFAFPEAAQAYELIDQHPDQAIQVVFTYL